jgi:signal transduction histidine kinase/CheY-like chemotaxis protein
MTPASHIPNLDLAARIFDSTDEHIAVVDETGIVVHINPAWERFAREHNCGRIEAVCDDALHFRKSETADGVPAHYEAAAAGIRAVQTAQQPVFELEYEFVQEAHKRWFKMRVLPLAGLAGWVWVAHAEITARKLADAKREQQQTQAYQIQKLESIGRLAGGVAHDFNNMLQAILGNLETVLCNLPADNPDRFLVVEALECAQHSANLTRQLLTMARKQPTVPRIIDLNTTVGGQYQMLRRLIEDRIKMIWLPGNDLWPLVLDPGQVGEILANLCLNARDAISGSGEITISTSNFVLTAEDCAQIPNSRPGDHVRLSVRDTGIGLPAEIQSHLFEPFLTTKDVGRAAGLGLSSVYGIVSQHKGCIRAQSTQGQGTTFDVFFPRHMTRAPSVKKKAPTAPACGHGVLLLVDDEPVILRTTARFLEKRGFTVHTAESTTAALQIADAQHGKIDLLLTDVVMPGGNGCELTRQLLSKYPHIRYILLSGYPADIIANFGLEDAEENFLIKPISADVLTARIMQILEARGSASPIQAENSPKI